MDTQPQETVLIVDDDDAKRHSIAKILRMAGFAIREGKTGADAFRMAADRPALLILDVKLPDISGFEVCRRIKEDPATATIPVLHISTTFVDIEDRIHGLEGGADGYLTDVLEPLELVATVRALLRARKAEEAALISSRQWQVTFDTISDGVILLDRTGRALQANSAMEAILAKSWNEISGQTLHNLLSLPATDEASPFQKMLRSGQGQADEFTVGDRWLRLTVDPIRDASGVVKGGLCIASDMTDRRRLEDELRRRAEELAVADRRKDELLAMLAHELRNPLAPIANALAAIRLDQSVRATTVEAVDVARRQVEHMTRLLDDLLDVSRFTRGNIQLKKVAVDLTAVLQQAVETSRPVIEASGHALTTSYPASPVWLEGDPTRLAQVVANLLNNAAKYTDHGGKLALIASREGDTAVIRVRDNGIGLSAEMLPHVFDLFAQEDRSLDRSQGGLGLGLTLVRRLVQLHEGSVSADSPGPGLGSEFTIRLPIKTDQSAAPFQEDVPSPEAAPQHVLRVLVVDDSQDAAWSLAVVLKLWGHECDVAHNGPAAIAAALASPFDLILLDIGLPGMSGYQVAERLRNEPLTPRPMLIALTGYGQQEDLARSRGAGFDDHFVKPVNLDKLQEYLSDPTFLENRRSS